MRKVIMVCLAGLLIMGCKKAKKEEIVPGGRKWTLEIAEPVFAPLSYSDGVIYCATNEGNLYAIDKEGKIIWSYEGEGAVSTAPVVYGSKVYYGTSEGYLYAVRKDSGKLVFQQDLSKPIDASIAVSGAKIIVPAGNEIYSVDTATGDLELVYTAGGEIKSSPIVHNGIVYFGAEDGKLYAIKTDGTKQWEFDAGSPIRTSPAIDENGNIYFGTFDGIFYCLNSGGNVVWADTISSCIQSSPIVWGNCVCFGANDAKIRVYSSGKLLWEFSTDTLASTFIICSPAITADSVIYVGNSLGKICAIKNDSLEWSWTADGAVHSAPLITPDSMAYFGSMGGEIWAIKTAAGIMKTTCPMFRCNPQRTGNITTSKGKIF